MPANTYGRQVVVALTNKSGGGVIAGDVVIVDISNNDSFTTTASANVTTIVGVAQETIANNAVGRVLISGYAALINVNASVTRGHYGATFTVAKQATDAGASRTAGTFVQFLTGGTTPDGAVFPTDLTTATGSPLTTKGDVYGYSTTNARIAVGADGYVLTARSSNSLGVAWEAATGGGGGGGGGLVLLEQHTASSSATLDFTTFISSTYDDYQIEIVDVLPQNNNVLALLRAGTGGGPTWDSGANYTWMVVARPAGAIGGSGSSGQTAIQLFDSGLSNSEPSSFSLRLFNPQSTTANKKISGTGMASYQSAASPFVTLNGGVYVSHTAMTGLRFLFDSGNIASGTIRIYGIAKS